MKIFLTTPGNHAEWIAGHELVDKIDKCDAVIFTGGEDVESWRYGEIPHESAYSNPGRDMIDVALYRNAVRANKFLIGICRGAQLLTVLAGGRLVQHVSGHANGRNHWIKTSEDKRMQVTSTHHQMMYPYTTKYEMLAVSDANLSSCYFKNDIHQYKMSEEPEVVYYRQLRALAIQPHPEWMEPDSEFVIWLNNILKKYYNE